MFPPELDEIVPEELRNYTLPFLTGSHAYGTNTPDSDHDYTAIYYHPQDDRRVFKSYPESLHSGARTQDAKGYSLRRFAHLVAKGDAECNHLAAHLSADIEGEAGALYWLTVSTVLRFMEAVRPHQVTRELAGSYLGHLKGVEHEIKASGVTAKRLSHGIRMASCALDLLREGDPPLAPPDFRHADFKGDRYYATAVKTEALSLETGLEYFNIINSCVGQVAERRTLLPGNEQLALAINTFFEEI